jgi:hypothetical protein
MDVTVLNANLLAVKPKACHGYLTVDINVFYAVLMVE